MFRLLFFFAYSETSQTQVGFRESLVSKEVFVLVKATRFAVTTTPDRLNHDQLKHPEVLPS